MLCGFDIGMAQHLAYAFNRQTFLLPAAGVNINNNKVAVLYWV